MKCSLGISNFLEGISHLSHFCCFPLFPCIDRWGRLSYLSLVLLGTLHSNAYIFPFLLCFSLFFFSQLFVRSPKTAILLFCISFPWGWSWSPSPVQCHERPSLLLGGIGGRRRRGPQRMTCPSLTRWTCFWVNSGSGDGQGGLACCNS